MFIFLFIAACVIYSVQGGNTNITDSNRMLILLALLADITLFVVVISFYRLWERKV